MQKPVNFVDQIALQSKKTLNGCIEWTGAKSPSGYGRKRVGRQTCRTHRIAYESFIGPIGELCVLHRCDNPLCLNPCHLFLGTQIDNLVDMTDKGRRRWVPPRGSKNGQAVLTEEDVKAIRLSTDSFGELARRFGVDEKTVRQVAHFRSWKHLV